MLETIPVTMEITRNDTFSLFLGESDAVFSIDFTRPHLSHGRGGNAKTCCGFSSDCPNITAS
jgi:hypothetical protein